MSDSKYRPYHGTGKHGGYDYWGRRPGNRHGANGPGRHKNGKKITHSKERAIKREYLYNVMEIL